jgi:hypothetical protein
MIGTGSQHFGFTPGNVLPDMPVNSTSGGQELVALKSGGGLYKNTVRKYRKRTARKNNKSRKSRKIQRRRKPSKKTKISKKR